MKIKCLAPPGKTCLRCFDESQTGSQKASKGQRRQAVTLRAAMVTAQRKNARVIAPLNETPLPTRLIQNPDTNQRSCRRESWPWLHSPAEWNHSDKSYSPKRLRTPGQGTHREGPSSPSPISKSKKTRCHSVTWATVAQALL